MADKFQKASDAAERLGASLLPHVRCTVAVATLNVAEAIQGSVSFSSAEEFGAFNDALKAQGKDPHRLVIIVVAVDDLPSSPPLTFEDYPVYVIQITVESSRCGPCDDDDCEHGHDCGGCGCDH